MHVVVLSGCFRLPARLYCSYLAVTNTASECWVPAPQGNASRITHPEAPCYPGVRASTFVQMSLTHTHSNWLALSCVLEQEPISEPWALTSAVDKLNCYERSLTQQRVTLTKGLLSTILQSRQLFPLDLIIVPNWFVLFISPQEHYFQWTNIKVKGYVIDRLLLFFAR